MVGRKGRATPFLLLPAEHRPARRLVSSRGPTLDRTMRTELHTSSREYVQPALYVGSRIEHESERVVLRRIVELLTCDRRTAVILANANVGDRQIDLVVALNGVVLVIEAKGYRRPIRGSENGLWQVQLASGEWNDIPSPYLQAREATLRVRDAMRAFERREIPYPRSAVVIVPKIPQGSKAHPGDFKVSIVGYFQHYTDFD